MSAWGADLELIDRRGAHTNEHLDNLLPCCESLNEDVGRLELMAASVLLAVYDQ